jgi:hypothetical protein
VSWLAGLAEHLADELALEWSPDTPYHPGDVAVVLEDVPTEPVELLVLTGYAGTKANTLGGTDEPRLQVRTRSARTVDSRDRCQAAYDVLHGLGPITLPNGFELQLCVGRDSGPAFIGQDEAGHPEHTANFDVSIYNPNRRGRSRSNG